MKTAFNKLTAAEVAAYAKGPAPAAKKKYADGGGLTLVHMPSGTLLWHLRYRVGGAEQNISLGIYPAVGLAEARAERDKARRDMAGGRDPGAVRKAEARAAVEATREHTFGRFADELLAYLKPSQDAATVDQWERQLGYAKAELAKRPIAEITAAELRDYLATYHETGRLSTMHGVKRKIGRVFRYAMLAGACPGNPVEALKGELLPAVAGHFPAIVEPAAFGAMLRKIAAAQVSTSTGRALLFLAHTFQRTHMVRNMRWRDLDFDAGVWRIEAAGMKGKRGAKREHIVPLSRQALAILESMKPVSGGEGREGDPVFPGRARGEVMSNLTLNKALNRLGFTGVHCAHGFRASANTMLKERLGYSQELIDRQLAHVIENTTQRAYDRAKFLDQRRELMAAWSDYLDTLTAPGGNVVAFPVAA